MTPIQEFSVDGTTNAPLYAKAHEDRFGFSSPAKSFAQELNGAMALAASYASRNFGKK